MEKIGLRWSCGVFFGHGANKHHDFDCEYEHYTSFARLYYDGFKWYWDDDCEVWLHY